MNIVEVTELSIRYGNHAAVDGVSFSVEEGEIFGILGPNGAGKTTTVESIGGLRTPDGGTIRVVGLDPQRDRDALRAVVGVQLRESELPDRMTVAEAIELFASFYADRPRSRDRRRFIGGPRPMSPIRLMIVDDHPVVRDGLRGMLAGDPDLDVVGEATDGAEALELASSLKPDVILMDLRMPRLGGAAAIKALAERGSEAAVLVLTTYDTDRDVVPALEAGATGYLLKDAPREELVRAIHAAFRGESVLAPSVATRLVSQLRSPEHEALSDRELEVLTLIAQGQTNSGAAARLFISEATVKTHLLHIYAKLGVNDRAAAVAVAYERGLWVPRRE